MVEYFWWEIPKQFFSCQKQMLEGKLTHIVSEQLNIMLMCLKEMLSWQHYVFHQNILSSILAETAGIFAPCPGNSTGQVHSLGSVITVRSPGWVHWPLTGPQLRSPPSTVCSILRHNGGETDNRWCEGQNHTAGSLQTHTTHLAKMDDDYES